MYSKKSPQENWHQIRHILKDYLMNTAVPIVFESLLRQTKYLNNPGYRSLTATPSSENGADGKSGEKPFIRYNLVHEAWENLLKEGLTDVFIHRLLGSQTDMCTYWDNSEKYRAFFTDILGGMDKSSELKTLTKSYFEMLKDYLCRNMPGMPVAFHQLAVGQVMKACRMIYQAHRLRDDRESNENRTFYIDFEEQAYSSSLLTLLDEIAVHMESHPKIQYYLVIAEYIHTLFMYVYMVEFVKLYPNRKGQTRERNPELDQGRYHNLFKYLGKVDYLKEYRRLENRYNRNKRE